MKRLLFALGIFALLVACGQPETTPGSNQGPGAASSAITESPTVQVPTATPAPTATPSPMPTATPTPSPTPSPTPTPIPPPTPSATAIATYPDEGTVFYYSPMTEIEPGDSPEGWTGTVTADGYQITVPADDDAVLSNSTTAGDGSYSVTLRAVDPVGDGAGCLMLRTEETQTNARFYSYCLLYSGDQLLGTQALYASAGPDPASVVTVELGLYKTEPGLLSTDWNTIKVVAEGDRFWFFLNDNYLGNATHSGASSGSVGVAGYNFELDQSQNIEFTDLTIRSLAACGPTMQLCSATSPAVRNGWQTPANVSEMLENLFQRSMLDAN